MSDPDYEALIESPIGDDPGLSPWDLSFGGVLLCALSSDCGSC